MQIHTQQCKHHGHRDRNQERGDPQNQLSGAGPEGFSADQDQQAHQSCESRVSLVAAPHVAYEAAAAGEGQADGEVPQPAQGMHGVPQAGAGGGHGGHVVARHQVEDAQLQGLGQVEQLRKLRRLGKGSR